MNWRSIGIFIAATIAVMILASTNVSTIIQQRQAYAASPTTSSLIDNLRANLGNRNQHLNQQGSCIRTNGCTTSDVVQGTYVYAHLAAIHLNRDLTPPLDIISIVIINIHSFMKL